jgi:hypothetical protein
MYNSKFVQVHKKTEWDDLDYNDWLESMIDQTLEDSFPASDPPAWTLGREIKLDDRDLTSKRDSLFLKKTHV